MRAACKQIYVCAAAGRDRSKAAVSMLLDTVGVGEAPDSPAHHTADSAQASEAVGLDRAGDAADEAPSLLDQVLSLPAPDHASPTLGGELEGEALVSLAGLSLSVTAVSYDPNISWCGLSLRDQEFDLCCLSLTEFQHALYPYAWRIGCISHSHLSSPLPSMTCALHLGLCNNILGDAGKHKVSQPQESSREQLPQQDRTSNQATASAQGPSLLDELLGLPAPAGETVSNSRRRCRILQLERHHLHMRRP